MIVQMVKMNGMLKPLEYDKKRLQEFKETVTEGQVVQVNFTTEQMPASRAARKYFHLMRDVYARSLGYEKEYAKDELCVGFGVSMLLQDALEDPPKWSGYPRKIWGKEHLRKSTTEYTTDEMAGLIEGTIQACIENGVDIQQLVDDYRQEVSHAD